MQIEWFGQIILAHALKCEHFKVGMDMYKQYEIQEFAKWYVVISVFMGHKWRNKICNIVRPKCGNYATSCVLKKNSCLFSRVLEFKRWTWANFTPIEKIDCTFSVVLLHARFSYSANDWLDLFTLYCWSPANLCCTVHPVDSFHFLNRIIHCPTFVCNAINYVGWFPIFLTKLLWTFSIQC